MPLGYWRMAANRIILICHPHNQNDVKSSRSIIEKFRHNSLHSWNNKITKTCYIFFLLWVFLKLQSFRTWVLNDFQYVAIQDFKLLYLSNPLRRVPNFKLTKLYLRVEIKKNSKTNKHREINSRLPTVLENCLSVSYRCWMRQNSQINIKLPTD